MAAIVKIYLDILHIYRSETVAGFNRNGRRTFYGTTFIEKITRFAQYTGKMIRDFVNSIVGWQTTKKEALHQKDWLYILGGNNYHSLQFLEEPGQTVYVSPFQFRSPVGITIQIILGQHLPNMLWRLPTYIAMLVKYPELRRCWEVAFKSIGLYESSLYYLKKYQPRCIIFSNDHTLEPRAMLLAAQALDIPTFYIQHACVRADFPPLRFTCSFLEGQDALDKYRGSGAITGTVELIGVPRIDPYLHKKRSRVQVKNIGLCSNLLDAQPLLEDMLKRLRESFPAYELSYRPHPVDKRKLSLDASIKISDSKKVNPFEFLLEQDVIIAGNTSIHYEAAMLNVQTLCYKFDTEGDTEDMYGFVAKGLVEEARTPEELIALIKKTEAKPNVDPKLVRYYNAALFTEQEGHSRELVRKKIHEILNIQKHGAYQSKALHR